MIKQNRNIELTPVSLEPLEHIIKFKVKIVSAFSKNDGLIRCASTLAIGNAKAPNPRTRLVLKSGAKVERNLRYAISAECAKLNSAEMEKGNPFGLPYILAYYAIYFFSLRQISLAIRRKNSSFNRIHIILNFTLHINVNTSGINLLSYIIAIRLGSHLHLYLTVFLQESCNGSSVGSTRI